jgi:Na+-transporting NADH:ubiquinone oxidoreductase subunit A
MAEYKLKRGYDIRLDGLTDREVVDAPVPRQVAIRPTEFRGIKPRPLVEEGQEVKVGTPLFHAKGNDDHKFASPVSGKVVAIQRGERRVITAIVVAPDGKQTAEAFPKWELPRLRQAKREDVLRQVLAAGVLGVFTQRPFGHTADPLVTPRDIFVTGFDSAPLAPDTTLLAKGQETAFRAGLAVAAALTSGKVYLGLDGRQRDLAVFQVDEPKVVTNRFTGPHPSGCVGVQIHHVAPIRGRQDRVWTANVQGILVLGKLFLEGRVAGERIVAVAGTGAAQRKYFRTLQGAQISSLVAAPANGTQVRYITGNVLTGRREPHDGFVGYHDSLVTVIPEATEPEFIGWMLPGQDKESYSRAFASWLLGGKRFAKDTRMGGGHRAMVATGYYEQVTPMDVLPMYLLKSILAEDLQEMEGLGIYEVLEEDLALCEYICPSKTEIQELLRRGLDLIEKEG